MDRSEFDHCLDLILEQHRQDEQVAWRHIEQSRRNRRHVWRRGDQHAALVYRALANQPLAEAQYLGVTVDAIIGIGGKELEFFTVLLAMHLVDDALMRVDQRRELRKQQ